MLLVGQGRPVGWEASAGVLYEQPLDAQHLAGGAVWKPQRLEAEHHFHQQVLRIALVEMDAERMARRVARVGRQEKIVEPFLAQHLQESIAFERQLAALFGVEP